MKSFDVQKLILQGMFCIAQSNTAKICFHNSSYERFLVYELIEPVLNYGSNEFEALRNLCETGPCC